MGGYTIERVLYNNGIFSLEEIYNHYEKDFEKGLAMLKEQERKMGLSPLEWAEPTDVRLLTGLSAPSYGNVTAWWEDQDYASAVNGEYGYERSIIGGAEVYSSIYAKYKLTCISDNAILLECTDYNRFTREEITYPPCIAVRQEDGAYHVLEESQHFGNSFRLNTSTREMIFESGGDFFYIFSKF